MKKSLLTLMYGLCMSYAVQAAPPSSNVPQSSEPYAITCNSLNQLKAFVTSKQEEDMVCRAWSKTVSLYKEKGFTPSIAFNLRFKEHVRFPSDDGKRFFTVMGIFIATTDGLPDPAVTAYKNEFKDLEPNTIYMTSYQSPLRMKKTSLGRKYTPELYEAVLVHEISHALNKSLYQYDPHASPPGIVDEYIAHVNQLESLSEKTRNEFLKSYPIHKYQPFEHDAEFNAFQYHVSGSADGFAARCWYYHVSEKGGVKMFNRIYSGDLRPMDLNL